jgi:hypothetical protein
VKVTLVGILTVSEQLITAPGEACEQDSEKSAAIPRVKVPVVSPLRVPRNCSAKEPAVVDVVATRVLVRPDVNVKVRVPPAPAVVCPLKVSVMGTTTPVPGGMTILVLGVRVRVCPRVRPRLFGFPR